MQDLSKLIRQWSDGKSRKISVFKNTGSLRYQPTHFPQAFSFDSKFSSYYEPDGNKRPKISALQFQFIYFK